jgi:hypothetical protein
LAAALNPLETEDRFVPDLATSQKHVQLKLRKLARYLDQALSNIEDMIKQSAAMTPPDHSLIFIVLFRTGHLSTDIHR